MRKSREIYNRVFPAVCPGRSEALRVPEAIDEDENYGHDA